MFKFFKKDESLNADKQFKDPVCGMKVGDKITLEYKGKVYGFCSNNCKQQFEKNPDQYIAK